MSDTIDIGNLDDAPENEGWLRNIHQAAVDNKLKPDDETENENGNPPGLG